MLPTFIAHADWGTNARKRVVATGRLQSDGAYTADVPTEVGLHGSPLRRLGVPEGIDGPVLLGFDFPIGLPAAYASRGGISSFQAGLAFFGTGDWARFYDVCMRPEEIPLFRPFYPHGNAEKGERSLTQLTDALGLEADDLLRQCERRTPTRKAANALFWTVGGSQVGKAATSGWREFIIPLIRESGSALWPFDGELADLLASRRIVITETYPTEFYRRFEVIPASKRDPGARRQVATAMLDAADTNRILLSDRARELIEHGFGNRPDGEDPFDAMVGLIGMVNHIHNGACPEAPATSACRTVEGWILGQDPEPAPVPHRQARPRPMLTPPQEDTTRDAGTDHAQTVSTRPPCICGCGRVPKGRYSRFVPGHDNRINPATGRRFNDHG